MESLLRLIALLLLAYGVLCAAVYLMQDRLIFYPRAIWREPKGPQVEPATLDRPGAALHGWVVKPDSNGPVLVYFGGNAEELSYLVEIFAQLEATTVLINYRGYGRSEGKPTARRLVEDAQAIVDLLVRPYLADRPLILFGRSLGSGIAALLTRSAAVDGVILMSPYRSLTHLAGRLMPWLPARWLLRHRIDVVPAVDSLPEKSLILYSPDDRIVPADESRALALLFRHAPRIVEFDGGHNVSLTHPRIWPEIEAFIRSVSDPEA